MLHAEILPYVNDFSGLPRTTQLVRENGIRSFLLHLHALEEMPEHKVNGAITVQVLQGSVLFVAADEKRELSTGSLISLPPAVPHSLYARAASLMLITAVTP